jgi:hypothetical protein
MTLRGSKLLLKQYLPELIDYLAKYCEVGALSYAMRNLTIEQLPQYLTHWFPHVRKRAELMFERLSNERSS